MNCNLCMKCVFYFLASVNEEIHILFSFISIFFSVARADPRFYHKIFFILLSLYDFDSGTGTIECELEISSHSQWFWQSNFLPTNRIGENHNFPFIQILSIFSKTTVRQFQCTNERHNHQQQRQQFELKTFDVTKRKCSGIRTNPGYPLFFSW